MNKKLFIRVFLPLLILVVVLGCCFFAYIAASTAPEATSFATSTAFFVSTFPNIGAILSMVESVNVNLNTWGALLGIFTLLSIFFLLQRKSKKAIGVMLLALGFIVGSFSIGFYLVVITQLQQNASQQTSLDTFGWKFPITKFPITGSKGEIAYSTIRTPGSAPKGLPTRLQIPSIDVDSIIEDALITPDGRMDVPAGSKNVAWFALGPRPGQPGSAVIGGHFGISNGVPWVFYNLDTLKMGDMVYVVDDRGKTLKFIVRSTQSFDRSADATTVFTSTDDLAHLNLITLQEQK